LDGAWREIESQLYSSTYGYYYYSSTSYAEERAYNSIGANVLLGADYYFFKNFYLGFEIGLGYDMLKYKQITLDISTEDEEKVYPSSKSVDFKFFYNNSIRLGIYF